MRYSRTRETKHPLRTSERSEDLEVMNMRLADKYGRTLTDRAHYRIVWSTDQTELRVGSWEEWYGNIYLRTYVGAKRVPKYPRYPDQYVLERLVYGNFPELPEMAQGSYEPLWFFRDTKDVPYYPFWQAVEFVMHSHLNPNRMTLSDYKEMVEREEQEEVATFRAMLDDEGRSPMFAGMVKPAVIDKTEFWDRS